VSIYGLKPRFQALLRPVAGMLYRAGMTANQVTLFACIVSVALGALLCVEHERAVLFLLVPLWFFVRMAFNAIDGMLAREFGQASTLGAYLNELTDVISDSALYLPFAFLPGSNATLVWVVIALSIISEYAGVIAQAIGRERRYDGPMGKSDRAFIFGLLGLLVGLGYTVAPVLPWAWAALALLVAVTIVNRVRRGLSAPQKS
jgi:CDP-diacylglycerol--glycerol-3-phosphate 3-phosphatidyltransferase